MIELVYRLLWCIHALNVASLFWISPRGVLGAVYSSGMACILLVSAIANAAIGRDAQCVTWILLAIVWGGLAGSHYFDAVASIEEKRL